MTNGLDKYRSRRNRAMVRNLFWREWDPIGVNDAVGAEDEYDRYADEAYVMLMDKRCSEDEITNYLYFISSDYMGIGTGHGLKDLARKIASRLIELRPDFANESNEPF